MLAGARRLASRPHRAVVRRAVLALGLAATGLVPDIGAAQTITAARYGDPTTRYDHGVLGDAIEWGALTVDLSDGTRRRFVLPQDYVFEDTAPRLADLDGDGAAEVITVESSLTAGARLAVYTAQGRRATTAHIGRKNRWLAPVGAADFTGDGQLEIAIIITPHLAGRLELLRLDGGSLASIATLTGLTNHRIGDREIAGGIRSCGTDPEMILAQMPWRQDGDASMLAISLKDGRLIAKSYPAPFTPENVAKAQACDLHPL